MTWFSQSDYSIRMEWGRDGLTSLREFSDVIVIVDVLSFTTCTGMAIERGAEVYPYPWKDERAEAFATSVGARLAGKRSPVSTLSLSPPTMTNLNRGEKVVLPSPNGSQLSTETGNVPTIAACLRNAQASARRAHGLGRQITVVAAGERWHDGESLRPSLEDLIGAGAVIASLTGSKSPEALAAERVFLSAQEDLLATIRNCASGRELVGKGYLCDVEAAALLNETNLVPVLRDGAYIGIES